MKMNNLIKLIVLCLIVCLFDSCQIPQIATKKVSQLIPDSYAGSKDTITVSKTAWRAFFKDPALIALIDSALEKNQEVNILMQEIQLAKNDVLAKQGAYLPFASVGAGAGVDKVGRYTSQGASDANNEIVPGKPVPDALQNYAIGINATWEIDVWKKLRNAKKSALLRYLSTVEGKNFMVTHLIAEIANSYYELMALDNQLTILNQNIELYQNSLDIVRIEKQYARVTELAVRRFEAEVFKTKSRQFSIKQQIVETENRINFLVGRFPQAVLRNSSHFTDLAIDSIQAGIPSQLLFNRTDIKQAELALKAAEIDVNVAKAEFYPSFEINAGLGYRAFNAKYFLQTPESLLFNLSGNLVAPLINRNAIKANFYSANNKQVQAVYEYERSILRAHLEVVNQLSQIVNLKKSYDLKSQQVDALTQSIEISSTLFKSARADYMEVLLTQRDALESKIELVETKKQQLNAQVNVYQALGGGWR